MPDKKLQFTKFYPFVACPDVELFVTMKANFVNHAPMLNIIIIFYSI